MRYLTALVLFLAAAPAAPAQSTNARAIALLDTAIARTGGDKLKGIRTMRFRTITQWHRINFDARPFQDYPSYETGIDVRDYGARAWRNTREFSRGTGTQRVVDVVADTIAARVINGVMGPLSAAYVDERRELWAWSGDRVLLTARAGANLRALRDTTIGGVVHDRVAFDHDGVGSVLHLRGADGLPAVVKLRAGQPRDFGLAPLGTMDLEIWYSQWRPDREGIVVPRQWDVMRAGRLYKRISILEAAANVEFAADSFAIPDSVTRAFFADHQRAMHDVSFDTPTRTAEHFVSWGQRSGLVGAVRVGGAWVLLESGQAPLSAERAIDWIKQQGETPALAVVGLTAVSNGGIAHTTRTGIRTIVAPGVMGIARAVLAGHGSRASVDSLAAGRWVRVGTDSIWVEPLDLPNARGTLLLWAPSLRYVYSPMAVTPLDRALVAAHARRRGWTVERTGSLMGVVSP